MGKVRGGVSMSLDGFITGPGAGRDNPLGDGGDRLHQWIYGLSTWRERHGLEGGERNAEADMLEASVANVGATIMGRGMFESGEDPWGDDPPFHMPVFVLTHEDRAPLIKADTTFVFVRDGVERALASAREAAGNKDITVGGGADTFRQFLSAGLLDEFRLDLVPVFMGDGVRLFEGVDPKMSFVREEVLDGEAVTHLIYRTAREADGPAG